MMNRIKSEPRAGKGCLFTEVLRRRKCSGIVKLKYLLVDKRNPDSDGKTVKDKNPSEV